MQKEMQEKDLLLLVVTTQKYHDDRIPAILDTWAKDNMNHILFLSDAPGAIPQIIDIGVPADYRSAPFKVLRGLDMLKNSEHYDCYKWYCLCDDDTFLYTDHLNDYISHKNPDENVCYGHVLHDYTALPTLRYMSGGAGMIFSNAAFRAMAPFLNGSTCYPYLDVTLGVVMREAGTKLVHCPAMNPQNPEKTAELTHPCDQAIKQISYHYMSPEKMREHYVRHK